MNRYELPPLIIPVTRAVQLSLFTLPRDFTRFDRRQHANFDNPWLNWARHQARSLGELRGWTCWVASDVDRALVILLSGHLDGEKVRYSDLFPALRARGLSVERTVEVLDRLGLLDDDRVPAFDRWLDRKLTDLAPGMRRDVEAWLRVLHAGAPRSRPRAPATIWNYFNEIQTILQGWSTRHGHLREVTRGDVLAARDEVHGKQRENRLVALRSLFGFRRKAGIVFRDPTSRVRVGRQNYNIIQPLAPIEVDRAVATATTAPARLILALAAVHAARPRSIRELLLDDVDLGNRRLTVAGHSRPMDDLTRQVILNWLDYHRTRWPNTANPHLLITQQTALEVGPVGKLWVTAAVRGLVATLERLRVDRQLEEALTCGPDPLHLAVVFGIDEKTAIRYAATARALLETPIERDPAG